MSIEPGDASGMDCGEMERTLEAYLDGELDGRERAEADAHLATCEPCRSIAETRGRLRAHVRARLRAAMGAATPAGQAPADLRDRIVRALAHERRPLWRRILSPLPMATLAACAAGAVIVLATHGGRDPLIEEAVRKHTRDLPLEVMAAEANADALMRALAGKLEFNARAPHFDAAGIQLVGARLTHLREKPAAYVRYDIRDAHHGELSRVHLGLFIIDDPDGRFGETGRPVHAGPATVRMVNAQGYNVVVWRRNEIAYSLVSDLDERDLVRLAAQAAADR